MPCIRGHDGLSFIPHVAEEELLELADLDRQDYVILNSTANVSKAIDVLHGYGRIHCMLDNDEAGRRRIGNWKGSSPDASATSPTTTKGIKT